MFRILRDEQGISSVEFALVALVFFMLCFGIVDFSRAMWHWNAAAKATHFGLRFAVVNDIVSLDYKTFSALGPPLNLDAGDPIPIKDGSGNDVIATIFCSDSDPGPGVTVGCGTSLASLSTTSADAPAFQAIVDQMQARYDNIEEHNVVIEYQNIGLGMSGNPLGPDVDPLVTIRLRDMEFELVTPGLAGIFTITMPDFAASLTGEDHVTI